MASGNPDAVSALALGTKCALHLHFELLADGVATARLRFRPANIVGPAFGLFDEVLTARRREACEFYDALQCGIADPDERTV